MKTRRNILLGIAGIVVLFLLIQLVPYGHNHDAPSVSDEPNWDSPDTRTLVKTACFDCHSNDTNWSRWYESIAPASWLVEYDVLAGRQRLNFSEWNQGGRPRELSQLWRAVQVDYMPPARYLWLHPEAKLSAAEKSQLVAGLQATFNN